MNEKERKSSVHAPEIDTVSMKEEFCSWVDTEAIFWQISTERARMIHEVTTTG